MIRHWLQSVLKAVVIVTIKCSGIRVARGDGPVADKVDEGGRAIRHTQQDRAASHK